MIEIKAECRKCAFVFPGRKYINEVWQIMGMYRVLPTFCVLLMCAKLLTEIKFRLEIVFALVDEKQIVTAVMRCAAPRRHRRSRRHTKSDNFHCCRSMCHSLYSILVRFRVFAIKFTAHKDYILMQ